MRILLWSVMMSLPVSYAWASAEIPLVQDGNSAYHIVLDADASPSEQHAAEELQSHVYACTGAELPISSGGDAGDVPMIVVGSGSVAEALGVAPSREQLGEQGCLVRTVPPHIVIAGTREAGTLYGVHRFLETYLGVRWYAPGVTKTPETVNLTIPAIDELFRPAFLYRNTSYAWPGKDADFLARLGHNGGSGQADHPWGIQYQFLGTAHSYFSFISPNEYFETHPEYFSEIGGIRRSADTQLCLTNPEVLEIVVEKMLARMAERPGVRQFNFSQMDYNNYCECPQCNDMNEQLGTQGGTQFWFVNELAKRTSAIHPEKLVSTLAYMYTEEPPREFQVHPNVAVWLCHMFPSCDSHPIESCPRNAHYKRRATEWSRICEHLYTWHYIVDFAHYYNPFPNFRAMAADLRFYRDLGFEGVFLQGMGHKGGGGEFSLLRPYYAMKLAWDPDQDPAEVIRDFLQGYYGNAWEPIWQYITLLHDVVERDNIHMHLYTNPAQGYLPDAVMAKADELFAQAEENVQDDLTLLERVQVARMPLDYAQMFPRNGYQIRDGRLMFQIDSPLPRAMTFASQMKDHGFTNIRESYDGGSDEILRIGALLAADPEVSTLTNEYLSIDIVPLLAGRVLRITDEASGKCVTAYNIPRSLFFPFCGGMESRVGELLRWSGWIEPAQVVEYTSDTITIALETVDGFHLERTVILFPKEPIAKVKTTLTNPSNEPRWGRLRNHLELDMGDLRTTRLRFESLAGESIDQGMTGVLAAMREGQPFRAADIPNGTWTFTGSKGLALTQRFDANQLDHTWIYAYPEELGELEVKLWGKRTLLQPGESISLTQQIEVRNND